MPRLGGPPKRSEGGEGHQMHLTNFPSLMFDLTNFQHQMTKILIPRSDEVHYDSEPPETVTFDGGDARRAAHDEYRYSCSPAPHSARGKLVYGKPEHHAFKRRSGTMTNDAHFSLW
ncbi:hypothetical protein C8J57DRAFT_1531800 [Mycena rebaudengoi]|nr:hypothetical protein C8J57DRAFT_1531800 [Mycena rebaudengoi]